MRIHRLGRGRVCMHTREEGDRSDHAGSRMTPQRPQKQGSRRRFPFSGVSGRGVKIRRLGAVFDPQGAVDPDQAPSRHRNAIVVDEGIHGISDTD